MRIDVLSTFPHMFDSVMGESMMRRAQEFGKLRFNSYDLRDWTHDRHRTTDDYPYGGGCGLVMKCEPIFEAMQSIIGIDLGDAPENHLDDGTAIVFMAPQGRKFDDGCALELSRLDRIVFVCGHYEGIDERAYSLATHTISLGDYVLTSGELASMVVIDAVVRKIPGVLGAAEGAELESFADGLLEFPQYTRPSSFMGMDVPHVLLSGHHGNIAKWRRREQLKLTLEKRPDLLAHAIDGDKLSVEDLDMLDNILETYIRQKQKRKP